MSLRARIRPLLGAVKDWAAVHGRRSGLGYLGRNERADCVCGEERVHVPDRIFQVTEKEDDPILPKYYYRCPRCASFSAPNIYFPLDKYVEVPLECFSIPDAKWALNRERVRLIEERASLPGSPVVFDLGSGEGCFSACIAERFPNGRVHAVESDVRMRDKFYGGYAQVTFEPMFIERFLEQVTADAAGPRADLVVLTDVLEHLVTPEDTLSQVSRALAPRGWLYAVVPTARTFDAPVRRANREIDWAHANRTCQHIWMYEPEAFLELVGAHLDVRWSDDRLETDLRRDSAYLAVLARKRERAASAPAP